MTTGFQSIKLRPAWKALDAHHQPVTLSHFPGEFKIITS
jgi:hypothetical protein